ncbi:hypothetical protein [Micromonospora sp. NPDC050495]|uniref:hypothetical protein n=1 Tax=Micromonospora sp. NPDC050495 TaxID=3154936 RepID=UPI0033C4EEAB
MIDLDDQDQRPARPGADPVTDGRKVALGLVAAFVAGVVLGGVGISQLRDSRAQRERNAVVALVAVPRSANLGGSSVQGSVQLSGLLMVVNTGPAPVTVRGVTAERPGVVLRSIEDSRLLPAGGTGQVVVELRFDCTTAFQSDPLSLRLSVETGDARTREVSYPVALFGSEWHRDAMTMC